MPTLVYIACWSEGSGGGQKKSVHRVVWWEGKVHNASEISKVFLAEHHLIFKGEASSIKALKQVNVEHFLFGAPGGLSSVNNLSLGLTFVSTLKENPQPTKAPFPARITQVSKHKPRTPAIRLVPCHVMSTTSLCDLMATSLTIFCLPYSVM
jgi:hypothetical protein